MVELDIEGHEVDSCFESVDRSVYFDVPVVAFIVDVLDYQTYFFMDEAVTAREKVHLVQLSQSLSQVAAAFFDELLVVIVILLGDRNWHGGVNDQG